jgi:membrane associated rhomboid family serine protease
VECPNCSGEGEKTTSRGATYQCKTCSGSGAIDCSRECSSCDGSGEITEQLQKETREKYRPRFANLSPSNGITVKILILNVIVYGVLYAVPESATYFIMDDGSWAAGHYWTIITASFVHFDRLHLLLNMIFLWLYGPAVEGILGKTRFVALYLFCALTAGAASWLGNIQLDHHMYAGVGASGPLYGLIGALFGFHLRWKMVQAADGKRLATWAAAFVVLGFALKGTPFDFLDNWGHLGGAIGGLIFAYILPRPQGR